MNIKEKLLLNIAKVYVDYHQKRKLIDELKYTRTIEFKECVIDYYIGDEFNDHASCYTELKSGRKLSHICDGCKSAWDRHLEIVKNGALAGGLKNKLNNLIKQLC